MLTELLGDHLRAGHVGGHDDEGVVDLARLTSLRGEIEGRSVEDLEDGVVGIGGETSFIPIEAVIDVRMILGEPVGHPHRID